MAATHDKERQLTREIAPKVESALPGTEVLACTSAVAVADFSESTMATRAALALKWALARSTLCLTSDTFHSSFGSTTDRWIRARSPLASVIHSNRR